MKEKNKPTAGPLFKGPQKQNKEQTQEPEETTTTADTGVPDTGGTLQPVAPATTAPLPVPIETGGDIQPYQSTIEDLFQVRDNLDIINDPNEIGFPPLTILKESQQFELPGDDPDSNNICSYIQFIIIADSSPNALFLPDSHQDKFLNNGTKYPDCHSYDGEHPVHNKYSNLCSECRFNEFGSVGLLNKDEGKGKACKNMIALIGHVIEAQGDRKKFNKNPDYENFFKKRINPVRLVLPPTSIKNFKNYIASELTIQYRVPKNLAVTEVWLEKVDQPFKYSVARFRFVDDLRPVAKKIIDETKDNSFIHDYRNIVNDMENFLKGNIIFNKMDVIADDPY